MPPPGPQRQMSLRRRVLSISVLGVTFGALAALLGVVLQFGPSAVGTTFAAGVLIMSLFFSFYKKKFPFVQPFDELKAWLLIAVGYIFFFFIGGTVASLVFGVLRGILTP